MNLDEHYMRRALDLAQRGLGQVSPNPMVGAVVVWNERVIGEGWHRYFGGPHAEVEAIHAVQDKSLLAESTIYVTLEPCSHFGKTPPCADMLVKAGLKKVVVATLDPNPLVAGKGIQKLNEAGIEAKVGVLEQESRALNKRFFTMMEKARPYIVLKWAQSIDGFIAPALDADPLQKQISNRLSQQLVHKWRGEEDAIMVGFSTLLYDDPRLNARAWAVHKQPIRVTWDEKGTGIGGSYRLLDGSQRTLVFNPIKESVEGNTHYLKLEDKGNALEILLEKLRQLGIGSLLVEGGTKLHQKFLVAGLWDEARICTSPKRLQNGIKAPHPFLEAGQRFHLAEDEWVIASCSQDRSVIQT